MKMKRKILSSVVVTVLTIILVFSIAFSLPFDTSNKEEYTYHFLIENGFTQVQAIGIMANIKVESDFDSTASNSKGIGFGLCQWSFGRKDRLMNYAESKGKSLDDFQVQLEFLVTELVPSPNCQLMDYKGYTLTAWENVKTAEEAAEIFYILYVRPLNPLFEERVEYAKYYQKHI